MLLDQYPTINYQHIKEIPWEGDEFLYDLQLYNLGEGEPEFLAINPYSLDLRVLNYITTVPKTRKCIVWTYKGEWVAKLFKDGWYPYHGYETYKIEELNNYVWKKNPAISSSITFDINPIETHKHEWSDLEYKLVWYLDPKVNPLEDKVWAFSCEVTGVKTKGEKDMGYVMPEIRVTWNPDLPKLHIDVDECYPPFWFLDCASALELDPNYSPKSGTWLIKFEPKYKKTTKWEWLGTVTPEFKIEQNPSLPEMRFDLDYDIPWHDLAYEHIWYLDKEIDGEKVWALKITPSAKIDGVKEMGTVTPLIAETMDVIFISYNESNAEENWARVLDKAPHAKRVDGVKGILEAHKAAAELSETDMFYVVDGDAYLVDDWQFNFQPGLYDRDCVYVWHSQNPINDLTYGYGGVKLFPKNLLLEVTDWGTDLTTSISNKLKVLDKISNVSRFNTDEFSTWRSSFRECAKLYSNSADENDIDSIERLEAWMSRGNDRPFGPASIAGAQSGLEYSKNNKDISNINDREWLQQKFNEWKENKLEKSKKSVICPVPWTHLNFEPNGLVVPCCLTSTYNYFAGDLKKQSIDEIWNSDNMKQLRKEMINGVEPEICSKCFNREKVTGESGRIYHIRDYPEVVKAIPDITLPDGTCTTMELKYWDFRFSNLCNFKCRSCGPRYSSAWVPDAKKMGIISEQEKVWYIDQVDNKTNFDFLKDQVKHVERIYFAGGEPLLMDEHWQILEMLVENNRFDVKLSYNTNCSVLNYGKKNVIDYWKKWDFGKLEVWPSLDEIGPRAELIRSGTVWSKVEDNLKELITLDNAIIRPGITIGAMNVFRLPEIITYLKELGVLKEQHHSMNFFINLLEDPKHYHVHILPDEFKEEIHTRLENFIADYNARYNTRINPLLKHIMHELKKPHSPESAKRFLSVTQQVDSVRGENIFDTIPELRVVNEMYPGIYRNDK
jgi:radical SAM protein with 4Fe4S-binding SPASM domain